MPAKGSRKPERAKYIEREECELLIRAPREAGAVRDHYLFATMFFSALRIGECVQLRPSNFDVAHSCLLVPTLKKRKKDKDGTKVDPLMEVPIFPEAMQIYREIAEWSRGREWVFPGAKEGRHITERTVENIFDKWCRALGLDEAYTPHSLRHSACSLIAKTTKDPILVRDFARHGNVSTTNVYLHGGKDKWVEAAGSLKLS